MLDQTKVFEKESLRYVSTFLDDEEYESRLKNEDFFKNSVYNNILDIGCGNGLHLYSLAGKQISGTGIEPSMEAIQLLKQKYIQYPNLTFECASAHDLPFESNSFDLVLCWSVLHWIGRNEYLQALGEMIRVCRKHLVVMDFVGAQNYKVPYQHQKGLYTYKMDFELPIIGSGIMEKIHEQRWWIKPGQSETTPINEIDLQPFLGNEINYYSRKMVVFSKNNHLLAELSQSDFSQ